MRQREGTGKKTFHVKFTTDALEKSPEKQLVLGMRQRNRQPNTIIQMQETGELSESEEEVENSNTSSQILLNLCKSAQIRNKMEYLKANISTIITDLNVLNQFFVENVSFKLLFRASNHNFNVKEFHTFCDQEQDTLTLCLTEDGKIIGGYTPLTWQDKFKETNTFFKTDFKRQTFLFSVTNNIKYPLAKALKNKAICCFNGYGPTFGGGYDLCIGNSTQQSPNTTSYFPRNFQHEKKQKIPKRSFTGTNRKNFKLQEWEVYKVIKKNVTMKQFTTIEQKLFDESQSDSQNSSIAEMLSFRKLTAFFKKFISGKEEEIVQPKENQN